MPITNEEVKYSFTADNSGLVKTVIENISTLDKYGKYLTQFATESLAATDKELKAITSQVAKVTSVATQVSKVFSDFQRQVEKFSTGFNWVDEAIRKQEKLAKSARESADVFKQAYADQNRNNAGTRGAINVDAPAMSAKESAEVFNQFFKDQETKLGGFLSKFSQTDGAISATTGKLAALGAKISVILAVVTKVFEVVKKIAPIVWEITKAVTKFVTSPLKLLQLGAKSLTDSFKSATSAFRGFGSLFGIGAGASLGVLFSESAKNASDMAEAINLFNVAMKGGREEGTKWIANLSEMSGMDMTNLMSITGLFYEMGAAVEMPHQAAMKLSKDLTELSMDISSLYNIDLETVTQNMTSGIRGMSRSVVKYGMDIRASTVEAFARTKYGITEQYETMNETNRIILRYLVMLDQASDSNSDFARTIEQPANQLRVFKQQIVSISREIGRFVIDAIEPLLYKINGLVMALRNIIKFVADFFGLWNGVTEVPDTDGMDDASDGIDGIGKAASGASKNLKRLLAPFDELNVLTQEATSGSSSIDGYGLADPRLLQALEEAETKFGEIEMKAHKVRDAVLEFFGFEYVFDPKNNLDNYIQVVSGGFADKLMKAFQKQDFTGVGKLIAEKLNPEIRKLADSFAWENIGPKIRSSLGAWIEGINGFLRTLNWITVGETFGNLVKTTFETINFAALSFDWTALGKAIADSLTGFFKGFDITSVGTTLANVLTSIANFASAFAKNFNWEAFGTNLGNSINAFFRTWDAKKLGTAANQIITKLLKMINKAIETTDWEQVGDKIAEFLRALKWEEILGLLGKTIWNALKAAVTAAVNSTKSAQFNKNMGSSVTKQQNAEENYHKSQGVTVGRTTTVGRTSTSGDSFTNSGRAMANTGRHFATGGVVTGPTRALIGEAGRAEMVMPLDNSPQMQQFISQIADAVRGNNAQPMEVHVYLDSRAIASGMYDELHNVEFRRGASLIS